MPVRCAVLLAAAAVSACAAGPGAQPEVRRLAGVPATPAPPLFAPEPTRQETFVGARRFEAGARLRFVSFSLSAREELRLQRCGTPCSTAKLVGSWHKADFDRSPVQGLVLAEAGDYYLWLHQELPNGEVGPVQALAATFERENGVLRFASGTVVFLAADGSGMPVDRDDDPVRIGTDPVQDEQSELRKLESPGILEKARHGVKQDLIVQIDAGADVKAMFRATLPVPGENLPLDPATMARRAAAWSNYHAALREVKLRMLAPLQASGVEMTRDFESSELLVVSVSSESALRALQAAPQVTVINENHRVVPS